jgi:hypothetical protein
MTLTIPATMDEVTPQWLTQALRAGGVIDNATVTAAEKETIGVGVGILGDLARVTPTYDRDEPGAPRTLVAKLPTQDPAGRGIADMLGFYEKEARIYHELASVLNTPRNYYSARDPKAVQYVILMEDVGTLRMGDQVAGASVEDADLLIREIAKLHRQWWESPELDALDWIPEVCAPQYKLAQGSAMAALEPFLQQFGERLTERQQAVARAVAPRFMAMQDALGGGPQTLCHGDLRLDNIFFGSMDGSRPVTLIDWQIATKARGPFDIAYFLSQSIDPKQRKANEEDWLRGYYETVVEDRHGYTWEECWHDYRAATLMCVGYPLVGGGSIDLGNERGVELVGRMALRSLTAVTDLDADELLANYEERAPIIPS